VADQQVPFEHIVQDAGSDDGTLDWLPSDPRVKSFVEKDTGMYDAVNRGLRRASGDIVAYLNCDEQYLPGALSKVRQFFRVNPEIEVIFGDAVAVDCEGEYLWHRKVLVPRKNHTAVCDLSVLTGATFFRSKLITDRGAYFNPKWRYCGDSAWVLRLLQQNVPMTVLRDFTSIFTHTGANLSLDPRARAEAHAFWATAPYWTRRLRPMILMHHRLRRLWGGIYSQKPFDYSVYTRRSPDRRIKRQVKRPSFRWKW
jgi:glycosyltransferase involved in cell wall biosynthesis